MLKRLFYSSAIILMLAVAYHFGYRDAQAQSGGRCTYVPNQYFKVDDQLWKLGGAGWQRIDTNGYGLPVSASSVIYLSADGYFLVSDAGEGWALETYGGPGGGTVGWHSLGFIPGGAVNVQPQTWTGVKEKYRK